MSNIYEYITTERNDFKQPINIAEGWSWNFPKHVNRSFLYLNSQFEIDNENRDKRPFNQIILDKVNVQKRTEGFDVKDVELFVKNIDIAYKSLVVRKFHEDWALENQMDTFIDDLVDSYVDYGGVLVKKVDGVRPEVVDLKTIAFCDQTNILSGPFAIKHQMSPDELRGMADAGWGSPSNGATIDLETLIKLSEKSKENNDNNQKTSTPGKYTEVFEVHGTFPQNWLNKNNNNDSEIEESKYVSQVQVVAFYKNEKDEDVGVVLFAKKEPKLPFKFLKRDKIQGRALGRGGVEELFEAQIWTNYSEVQMREMLELASKIFYKSTDPRFKTRNNISNRPTGTVFDLQDGKDINQLDTTPRNINIFENAVQKWEARAQRISGAGDILLGDSPSAGTPFKSVETQLVEGKSLHVWRQGKIATFMEEIYREWVLPYIAGEIAKGKKFLADLSMDELEKTIATVTKNQIAKIQKERVLNGEDIMTEEEKALEVQSIREGFLERGQEQPIEILKNEFAKEDLGVYVNIAGKQKNLAAFTDKMTNFIRQIISAPQLKQDPDLVRLTNEVLEASGMSPISYGLKEPMTQVAPQGQPQPLALPNA